MCPSDRILSFEVHKDSPVRHITDFSDNCRGQNRTCLVGMLGIYILKNKHIETVDHWFLIFGRFYNEYD